MLEKDPSILEYQYRPEKWILSKDISLYIMLYLNPGQILYSMSRLNKNYYNLIKEDLFWNWYSKWHNITIPMGIIDIRQNVFNQYHQVVPYRAERIYTLKWTIKKQSILYQEDIVNTHWWYQFTYYDQTPCSEKMTLVPIIHPDQNISPCTWIRDLGKDILYVDSFVNPKIHHMYNDEPMIILPWCQIIRLERSRLDKYIHSDFLDLPSIKSYQLDIDNYPSRFYHCGWIGQNPWHFKTGPNELVVQTLIAGFQEWFGGNFTMIKNAI